MLTQEEQKDMFNANTVTNSTLASLKAAFSGTTTIGGLGNLGGGLAPDLQGQYDQYTKQLASYAQFNSASHKRVPMRERLEERRKKAEAELIRINKLQDLMDSLPPGLTEDDLNSLINL